VTKSPQGSRRIFRCGGSGGFFFFGFLPAEFNRILRHKIKKYARIKSPMGLKYGLPPSMIEKTAYPASFLPVRNMSAIHQVSQFIFQKLLIYGDYKK
jgi:hypothetical protein